MEQSLIDNFMNEAYLEALKAYDKDEVPVGAVVVYNNEIIARAHNIRHQNNLIHGHAEFLALELAAKKIGSWRLEDCYVFVTLEPCAMCAGAMVQARIKKCYFSALDLKSGAVNSIIEMFNLPFTHHVDSEYYEDLGRSSKLLKDFFAKKRKK